MKTTQMGSQMTVGKKLMLSFAGMFTLIVISGSFSLYRIEDLSDDVRTTGSVTARKVDLAGELNEATAEMTATVKGAVLAAALNDSAELEESGRLFKVQVEKAEKALAEIRPLVA